MFHETVEFRTTLKHDMHPENRAFNCSWSVSVVAHLATDSGDNETVVTSVEITEVHSTIMFDGAVRTLRGTATVDDQLTRLWINEQLEDRDDWMKYLEKIARSKSEYVRGASRQFAHAQ